MHVLVGRFELHIPYSRSLKEKRMIVKSLRGRIREKFEVSCSEVAMHDLHQRSVIGVSAVGPDRVPLESLFEHISSFVEANLDGELLTNDFEILDFAEEAR